MEKIVQLYQVLSRIGGYPSIHITQKKSNEFKIEISGNLMESYIRLGEIQEEITNEVGDYFELHTIYGDGQDAIFRFIEK